MKLLFDTHAFVWWDASPGLLPASVQAACEDPGNQLILSVVSAWEIQVKVQLGKFQLSRSLKTIVADQVGRNNVQVLPVSLDHVLELQALPNHHRDPFDRLLVAQARVEDASLLTRDQTLASYPVKILWH